MPGRGKSITVSFDSLKGELWQRDHSNPPPTRSIMFFRMLWVSSSVLLVATNAQSSTKPVESSSFLFAMSMRSAL